MSPSREITVSCVDCGIEFRYEGKGGRRRRYCGGGKCATPRARAISKCSGCGKAVESKSSKPRKWCGDNCRRKATYHLMPSQNWSTMTDAQRAARADSSKRQANKVQAEKIAKLKAGGTYRFCEGCGGDMPQLRNRSYCDLSECRELAAERSRVLRNASNRGYQARYRAEHGLSNSQRYKDRPYNKEYNYRERHPDRAKFYDHARRAREANCEREAFADSEIFERDGFVCGICNEPVDMEVRYPDAMSASLDHIIPLSRGGGHVRANVRLAHLGCNARKCARLDDEMIVSG